MGFMNVVTNIMNFSVMLFVIVICVAVATGIGLVVKRAVESKTDLNSSSVTAIAAFSGIGVFIILIGPIGYIIKKMVPIFFIRFDLGSIDDLTNMFSS